MTRIPQKFQQLKERGKTAFMPFVVAGDPDYETSLEVIKTLLDSADLLEIGFPYSDPLADGPVIQAADQRALQAGVNSDTVFDLIKKVRTLTDIPITVLVYANLVYQRGIEKFYQDAKAAGIDGVLIPDVPVEESGPYVASAQKHGVDQVFLVTQTTTDERLQRILEHAHGYLYLVSVLGVTGEREELRPEILELIQRVQSQTDLPLAVGFGISQRSHIEALTSAQVNGYIIGSALIKIIEQNLGKKNDMAIGIKKYIEEVVT